VIPRCKTGQGVSGAVRYALSEGNDPATGKPRMEPKGEHSRVAWIGGTGFGFPIASREDADLARRMMEFTALNQSSRTKPCIKDCVHLSLGWRPGERPTRKEMEHAAHAALAAIGMGNARALFVAHADEPYAHLHIIASKIDPTTGRAYDLKGNFLKLSQWAESYERQFSGGVVITRRAESNQMREAIERRDPAAVLELMTQQRATFRPKDLDRELAKQIRAPAERARFADRILSRHEVVRLADSPGGPETRYTTRAVLNAEGKVLRAATNLAGRSGHQAASIRVILGKPAFAGMSPEQAAAVRHATDGKGLALIDGQAGTGKSFTVDAIRQIYERDGRQVIGLAPTNAVAQDMQASGFRHASTLHSELFRLNSGRTAWNDRTVVILDEAAMIDTKLMSQLAGHAERAGAKLIMVGDDRQLSSIDRGGMFGVLKDRYGAAELAQVRRQSKNDDRRAAELMAEGNFHSALGMYDQKGAIHWTATQDQAAAALVDQWAKDSAADPSKSRFVFAYTNADVDRVNAGIRAVRKGRGDLAGPDRSFETKHGRADFAVHDRIQLTGTDKARGLINGAAGTVEKIEGDAISMRLDGRTPQLVTFDAGAFKDFRHGYAGTIYKGQGRTLDQTYLYHSEHWRSAASYVALTRHREKAELFVARETAADVKQLARQMARVDDRRAASHFHVVDAPVGAPIRPATTPATIERPPACVQSSRRRAAPRELPRQLAPTERAEPRHQAASGIRRAFTVAAGGLQHRLSSPHIRARLDAPGQRLDHEHAARAAGRLQQLRSESGAPAREAVPVEDNEGISFEGEVTLLSQMYSARIEATRRALTGSARASAVRALKHEKKAAVAELTMRRRGNTTGRRAKRQHRQERQAAERLAKD
jgi:Ti-type conjugative transfer relaxase TraA